MLEWGQGLYFTPKRARKFKVGTVYNLFPGLQQGTNVDMVPQPHWRTLGVTPITYREQWLPNLSQSLAALPKGEIRITICLSRERGKAQIISVHQVHQHLYPRRMTGFEERKSTTLFGKCSSGILSHAQQKGLTNTSSELEVLQTTLAKFCL